MPIKSIIFLLLISLSSLADSEQFVFEKSNLASKKNFFLYNGMRISDSDECRKKLCHAYKIASGQKKVPVKKIEWLPGGVNPTSTLCKKINGDPRIGYMPNKNEVSLCYFKDQSFIFGWDLIK